MEKKSKLLKTNKNFFETNFLNDEVYLHYYNIFIQICLSMFEWVNLPSTMNARFLERTLFYRGMACLLYDKKRLYINTPCTVSGNLNIYEEPTQVHTDALDYHVNRLVYKGKKENAKESDCILVYNNQSLLPTVDMIEIFAYKLYLADMIAMINMNSQRTPLILLADENSKLTIQNLFNQLEANEFKIVLKKNFDMNAIQTLDLKAPFVADKIYQLKYDIWNEALTMLGINNIRDKKERLVENESEQNNELINFNLQSYLVPRQEACKQFNELFEPEKEISVKVRSDLHNIIKQYESVVLNKAPRSNINPNLQIEGGKNDI